MHPRISNVTWSEFQGAIQSGQAQKLSKGKVKGSRDVETVAAEKAFLHGAGMIFPVTTKIVEVDGKKKTVRLDGRAAFLASAFRNAGIPKRTEGRGVVAALRNTPDGLVVEVRRLPAAMAATGHVPAPKATGKAGK